MDEPALAVRQTTRSLDEPGTERLKINVESSADETEESKMGQLSTKLCNLTLYEPCKPTKTDSADFIGGRHCEMTMRHSLIQEIETETDRDKLESMEQTNRSKDYVKEDFQKANLQVLPKKIQNVSLDIGSNLESFCDTIPKNKIIATADWKKLTGFSTSQK